MDKNNVIVVNHGKVFNDKDWYTFYCPHCDDQLSYKSYDGKCEHCGKEVKWSDK